jgi:hypothetical protein
MPKAGKKLGSILVSASELAEIIGADFETVNNWVRRGIISRAPIGGRQLRARLFSINEIYGAALTNELVSLGIAPSPASEASNSIWNAWEKKPAPDEPKVYAIVVPSKDGWTVELCSRKAAGGPLYGRGKSTGTKSVEIELPKQAFAVIPISDVFERVSSKIAGLLGG